MDMFSLRLQFVSSLQLIGSVSESDMHVLMIIYLLRATISTKEVSEIEVRGILMSYSFLRPMSSSV